MQMISGHTQGDTEKRLAFCLLTDPPKLCGWAKEIPTMHIFFTFFVANVFFFHSLKDFKAGKTKMSRIGHC